MGVTLDNANRVLEQVMEENKNLTQQLEELQDRHEEMMSDQGTVENTIKNLKEIGNKSEEALKERLYAISYDLKQHKKKHHLMLDTLKKVKESNSIQEQLLQVLNNELNKLEREWSIVKYKTGEALLALAGEMDENDENRKAIEQLIEGSKNKILGEKVEVDLPAKETIEQADE